MTSPWCLTKYSLVYLGGKISETEYRTASFSHKLDTGTVVSFTVTPNRHKLCSLPQSIACSLGTRQDYSFAIKGTGSGATMTWCLCNHCLITTQSNTIQSVICHKIVALDLDLTFMDQFSTLWLLKTDSLAFMSCNRKYAVTLFNIMQLLYSWQCSCNLCNTRDWLTVLSMTTMVLHL